MSDTPKFKIYKRFDEALAEKGIEYEVNDHLDNLWGKFTVGLMDQDSRSYKLAQDRINERYAKLNRNKKPSSEDQLLELFVETALKGWSDVLDADDKAIPFNKENALAYFHTPGTRHVLEFLFAKAGDPSNFGLPKKGEVLGN